MSLSGFFMRGVTFELPHKEIDVRQILVVHAVLARALALLHASPPPPVLTWPLPRRISLLSNSTGS